jgi:hypothetical protein
MLVTAVACASSTTRVQRWAGYHLHSTSVQIDTGRALDNIIICPIGEYDQG